MDKDVRDYLKYYIGQEAKMPGHTVIISHSLLADEHAMKHWGIRPILRSLLSMTDEEIIKCAGLMTVKNIPAGTPMKVFINDSGHLQISVGDENAGLSLFPLSKFGGNPELFHYLLSSGFDLFGLIDAGLAVDKATIKS